MYKNIRLEVSKGIAKVYVDRPKSMNALNEETLHELRKAFEQILSSQGEIRVVILTGAGEKSFMAGADLIEIKDKDSQAGERYIRLGQALREQMENLAQPVIGAVNVYALGGGCELAMACDFILASESALFGQPEVALGMTPFFGGCYRLQRLVGMARAKELIFTGRKFTAQEAKEFGLVLEVLPRAQLLPRAEAIAQEMMKMSPLAIARAKKTIRQIASLATSEGLDIEAKAAAALFGTHDQREGMNAFAEKRKPNFNGT